MGRKFTVTTSGFCPETGKQQTITVALESIQLGGGIPSGNKVMSYSCPYAQEHDCASNGPDGRSCPLLRQIHG